MPLRAARDVPRGWPARDSVGVVMVAEAAGLVGAALRQSPADCWTRGPLRASRVRKRLTFTAEPRIRGALALVAGVVQRAGGRLPAAQLRPLGRDAARGTLPRRGVRFRPIRKGTHRLFARHRDSALRGPDTCRACCTCCTTTAPCAGVGREPSSCAARAGSAAERQSPDDAAHRRVHDRADPVAAGARRLHQLPHLRVPRHHGRRLDHARCARSRRVLLVHGTCTRSLATARGVRGRRGWRARRRASCTRGSRSTGCCPASS